MLLGKAALDFAVFYGPTTLAILALLCAWTALFRAQTRGCVPRRRRWPTIVLAVLAPLLLGAAAAGVPIVYTNQQLGYLSSWQYFAVLRLGVNQMGDAPPQWFWGSEGVACTIAGGDIGSQVPATGDGGCWNGILVVPTDAREFATPTMTSDATASLNAALKASRWVLLPPGPWHVTDEIMCPSGHSFTGAGVRNSSLTVGNAAGNDFNMSAAGVVRAGTPVSQTNCYVDGMTISFYQNQAAASLADIIQYPPGVEFSNIHGGNLAMGKGLDIDAAWTCLYAASPTYAIGGTHIGRMSCSSFNRGFYFQGSTAFIDIGSWDQETYGLGGTLGSIYQQAGYSGAALCGEIAGDSGLAVTSLECFSQGVTVDNSNSAGGYGGANGLQAGMLMLDSDGAVLNIPDGTGGAPVKIGTLYSTKGLNVTCSGAGCGTINAAGPATRIQIGNFSIRSSQTQAGIHDIQASDGATIRLANGYYLAGAGGTGSVGLYATGANSLIAVNDATIQVTPTSEVLGEAVGGGGNLTLGNDQIVVPAASTTAPLTVASASSLNITSGQFVVPNAARTVPVVDCEGYCWLVGNNFTGGTSGFGNVIKIGIDAAQNKIAENQALNWGLDLSGVNMAHPVGYYDLPNYPMTVTVTPQFATTGDFTVTGTPTTIGSWFLRGNFAEFHYRYQFSGTWTTAAGGFDMATNLPGALPGESTNGLPVTIASPSGITYSAGQFPLSAGIINGSSKIYPGTVTSGGPTTSLVTANFPSPITNAAFEISGRYRIR